MSFDSPVAILFNSDGYELATKDGYSLISSNSGLLVAGSDGANVRYLKTNTSGNLVVNANAGTGPWPVTDNSGSLTVDTGQLPVSLVGGRLDSNNGAWLGSTAPTVGSKTSVNSIPVVVASDQGAITVNASATVGLVDNAAFTDGTTRVQPVGFIFDETAGTALTENDAGAARIDSKRAQVLVIEDGTTRGRRTTVKAASTAAAAADTALVVAISPNNTIIATGNKTNNSTAPSSDNLGILPVIATAAAPSFTEGNLVALSSSLNGSLRIDNSSWLGSTAPTVGSKTSVNSIPVVVASDQGEISVAGSLANNASTPAVSNIGVLGAIATSSAPTYTDGYQVFLSTDLSGAIRVTGAVTAVNASVSSTGAAPPSSATYVGGSVTTSLPSYTTGQMSGLSLTTDGLLRIDGSNSTQPVSGTVAATQSGTWTVQPGNTANTTPWLSTISQGGNAATVTVSNALKVDGSASTQPVSGTLIANIGTSGSLALDATVAKLTIAQGAITGSNTQALAGSITTTTAPTYTTATINPLSTTTAGALRVDGSAVTQPVSGTVSITTNSAVNLAQVAGTTTLTGNGLTGTGSQRVTIASDNTALSVNSAQSGTWNITNVSGTVSLPTGASTSALQTTGNSSLSSIDSKTPALGQAIMSSSVPVVIASNQGALATTGSLSNNSATPTANHIAAITARATTAAPVYIDGYEVLLSTDLNGALRVAGTISASNPSVSATGAAPPASATYAGGSVTTTVPSYTTGQMSALSLTTSGLLRVDNSGVTQPVSGIVAATQSGTWTVQPGNTANTTPWLNTISQGGNAATVTAGNALKVDGSAVTQPISGSITANIGTSGSLALESTLAKLTIAQGVATGTNTQALAGTITTVAAPAYTTATINPLSTTAAGALRVDGSAVTQPVSGTVSITSNSAVNLAQVAGVATSTGNGVAGTGVQRVTIASDNTAFSVNAAQSGTWNITNISGVVSLPTGAATESSLIAQSLVDNAAFTDGTSRIVPAGFILDETAGIAITENDAGVARIDSKRAQVLVIEDSTTRGRRTTVDSSGRLNIDNSSWIGSTAPTVGQKTMSSSIPVVIPSDQTIAVTTAPSNSDAGFVSGDVTTTALTKVTVRRTAYTEQTSGTQRSIVSANANDSAAGTGARTVKIIYFTSAGAGPLIETITMNGTVAVNTIATDICYIENIEVITAGSTGSNVGIISLKAAAGGGGVTICTIAATDNRTFFCHHYAPTGKTCHITSMWAGHTGTTVGSGATFIISALPIGIANAVEKQVSDSFRLYGQSSSVQRNYGSPIEVIGPARLVAYVTPETATSTNYRASFDFYEV